MNATYRAATFIATRNELLGTESLLASAEIARDVCRTANRTVSVLAITSTSMCRVDGWLGAVGFVTHAAAADQCRPLLGSVSDLDRASALISGIISSLVGDLPDRPATGPLEMPGLSDLEPGSILSGVDWIVVCTTSMSHASAQLWLVGADGLLASDVLAVDAFGAGAFGADVVAVDRPIRLQPIDRTGLHGRLVELIGDGPRSVRDLLGD